MLIIIHELIFYVYSLQSYWDFTIGLQFYASNISKTDGHR